MLILNTTQELYKLINFDQDKSMEVAIKWNGVKVWDLSGLHRIPRT